MLCVAGNHPAVVMDQHRGVAGEYIVGVGVGYGEIVGLGGVGIEPLERVDDSDCAVRCMELVTPVQVLGVLPLPVSGVPEGVVFGGDDLRAVGEGQGVE